MATRYAFQPDFAERVAEKVRAGYFTLLFF